MMKCSLLVVAFGLRHLGLKQDPCAGCNVDGAVEYQKCARDYGNACALELDDTGAKNTDGKKKHYGCMKCKSMDCQYDTCNVNKHYYSTYAHAAGEMTKDKEQAEWESQAKEGAGW